MTWLLGWGIYFLGTMLMVRFTVTYVVTKYQKAAANCWRCRDNNGLCSVDRHHTPWKWGAWKDQEQLLVTFGSVGWPIFLLFLLVRYVLIPLTWRMIFPFGRTTRFERQQQRLAAQQQRQKEVALELKLRQERVEKQYLDIRFGHAELDIPFPPGGWDVSVPVGSSN